MEKKLRNRKSVREVFAGDEILLGDLFGLFLERKKYVVISLAAFFCLGILIAVTSPYEYESEAQILSESSESSGASLGGLAGLAGLAGISLPSGSQADGLSADMYPSIVSSEPFLLDLMEEKFFFQEKGQEMTLFEYFSEERPGHLFSKTFDFLRGIPGRFFSMLEKKKEWEIPAASLSTDTANAIVSRPKIVNVSREQKYVISQLSNRIQIESQGKIISLKIKMPEPYVSAELNTIVLEKVVDYLVQYKTDKQRENLSFVEERTKEAEAKFKEAQLRLASFRDANQGIVSQTAKTKEEQLLAEYNLAFNIYSGLAQQLEQTRIQLKKETPIFTEFEPVTIPLDKAEPKIPKLIFLYTALGFVIGGLLVIASIIKALVKEPEPVPADSQPQ